MAPDQWRCCAPIPTASRWPRSTRRCRFEPITPFTARITTAEIEYRGVTFPAGSVLLVSAWHANRQGIGPATSSTFTADRAGRGC